MLRMVPLPTAWRGSAEGHARSAISSSVRSPGTTVTGSLRLPQFTPSRAIEATSGPVRFVLTTLHGPGTMVLDPTLRFSLAVMGAVSLGWTATLAVILRQAMALGDQGRGLWTAITAGLVTWFVIDSTLSVATGFGLNVLPNLILAGMYGVGLVGSGVLKARA